MSIFLVKLKFKWSVISFHHKIPRLAKLKRGLLHPPTDLTPNPRAQKRSPQRPPSNPPPPYPVLIHLPPPNTPFSEASAACFTWALSVCQVQCLFCIVFSVIQCCPITNTHFRFQLKSVLLWSALMNTTLVHTFLHLTSPWHPLLSPQPPGSRDRVGRAVLEVHGDRQGWTSPLLSAHEVCKVLLYLHFIPR